MLESRAQAPLKSGIVSQPADGVSAAAPAPRALAPDKTAIKPLLANPPNVRKPVFIVTRTLPKRRPLRCAAGSQRYHESARFQSRPFGPEAKRSVSAAGRLARGVSPWQGRSLAQKSPFMGRGRKSAPLAKKRTRREADIGTYSFAHSCLFCPSLKAANSRLTFWFLCSKRPARAPRFW